jgi:16S rRNA processing protein RimM
VNDTNGADDLIAIGRVVKPQGRRGEVLVEPLTDRPERFPSLHHAFVEEAGDGPREVMITSCWPHKGRFVLKLEGVDSITEAEAFRGREIRLAQVELEPLPDGSYYHHQLRGLRVEAPNGQVVGQVEDLVETGAGAAVLVVRGGKGEHLVPLAEAFVKAVDLSGGRMVVELPVMVDVDD